MPALKSPALYPDPTCGFPRTDWRTTTPTARILRRKMRLLEDPRTVDIERARYTTQSYRESEGEAMPIRRAKMLRDLVHAMTITIDADELIVGNRSPQPRQGIIAPEGAVNWIDQELDILATRPQDRFNIRPEEIRELREEIFPYWRGQTLEDVVARETADDVRTCGPG